VSGGGQISKLYQDEFVKINDLPDPEGLYSTLPSIVHEEMTINVLDIRDRNGLLIHPKDYMTMLEHGLKVAIEVIMKL
jgi:hypothetical protein